MRIPVIEFTDDVDSNDSMKITSKVNYIIVYNIFI